MLSRDSTRTNKSRPASGERLGSSYRDPSGFVFLEDGVLLRQINRCYERDFALLESSGLYADLTAAELLIPHERVDADYCMPPEAIVVIRPAKVDFISYPYEWCFSQLKDAALLTLDIQMRALGRRMSLKDASAYNVQFLRGKPIFIDTLSFEAYEEGRPWIAYRQFCSHFLAPLALMAYVDSRLNGMLREHIDGIPLDLAAKMMPSVSKLRLGLALHLHGGARAERNVKPSGPTALRKVSVTGLKGLLANLRSTVEKLDYRPEGTVWADYYSSTNYSKEARKSKEDQVAEFLDLISPRPQTVWDLGANTGEFSSLASKRNIFTVAWDMDVAAVERCYRRIKEEREVFLLPLVQDLTNPSPGIGWANTERDSLAERGPADVLMALALVHHLAIGNNLPFGHIAAYFASLGHWLIIEFIPKDDSQTQRLLSAREDIFDDYTQQAFEKAFHSWFEPVRKAPIEGSMRTLYLFKRRPQ